MLYVCMHMCMCMCVLEPYLFNGSLFWQLSVLHALSHKMIVIWLLKPCFKFSVDGVNGQADAIVLIMNINVKT